MFNSPKNFKRGRLISNRYRVSDLILAGICCFISLVLLLLYLLVFKGNHPAILVLIAIPAGIGAMVISPLHIYHNILEYAKLYIVYSNCKKNYIWEGIYKVRHLEDKRE